MGTRDALYRAYWATERILLPGVRSTQQEYFHSLAPLVHNKDWLDIGCGHSVFWPWMEREEREVTESARSVAGIDLDWRGLIAHRTIRRKAFASACELPFADGSFDVVSANMVMEHLPVPSLVVDEAFRVLRPGGTFVFHTPNVDAWPTSLVVRLPEWVKKLLFPLADGRDEGDVFPTHYRVNTPGEIERFAQCRGFHADVRTVSTGAVSRMFLPAAIIELLYIRALRKQSQAAKRSNIIAVLSKVGSRLTEELAALPHNRGDSNRLFANTIR